ncbi:MAG: OmpA family protein [Bacteroidota bacterium]
MKYLTLLIAGIITSSMASGQLLLHRADQSFEDLAYADAIQQYERMYERDSTNTHVIRNLAISFYEINNAGEAEKWYGKLVEMEAATTMDYYHYIKLLQANEKYEEAQLALCDTIHFHPDSLGSVFSGLNEVHHILADSGAYGISILSCNDAASDFGPTFYKEQLVFTSARTSSIVSRTSQFDNQGYLNLYVGSIGEDGDVAEVEELTKDVESRFNDGPVCFNRAGDEMFITRNHRAGEKHEKKFLIELFQSDLLEDGKWSDPLLLTFNRDTTSTGHPSLSADGQTLYFTANMPGGMGGTDIWSSTRQGDTLWGEPVNLGPEVNTLDDEMFPFISDERVLYFSSKGHPGLGGLDVFSYNLVRSEKGVENLGTPINSSKDDFGFILRDDKGYFATNREQGGSFDELYFVKKLIFDFEGVVLSSMDSTAIDSAMVHVLQEEIPVDSAFSADSGRFVFHLVKEQEHTLVLSKAGYRDTSMVLDWGQEAYYMQPVIPRQDTLVISNVFYKFDQWKLPEIAYTDFDQVVLFMEENPRVTITVNSHTDHWGSDSYNQKLSEKRAKDIKTYLVERGIGEARIEAVGHGESQLVNRCADGVWCSVEENRKNRRTEIVFQY